MNLFGWSDEQAILTNVIGYQTFLSYWSAHWSYFFMINFFIDQKCSLKEQINSLPMKTFASWKTSLMQMLQSDLLGYLLSNNQQMASTIPWSIPQKNRRLGLGFLKTTLVPCFCNKSKEKRKSPHGNGEQVIWFLVTNYLIPFFLTSFQ